MKLALYKTILQPRYVGTYYLGFGLIKAYLAERMPGLEVCICHTPEELLYAKPDLVGVSSVTEAWEATKYLSRIFKERLQVPVVIGGQHISALPRTLPPWADIGVIGEGEVTFHELLMAYRDGKFHGIEAIRGIAFHDGGQVRVNRPRPLLDMDELPAPAAPHSDRYRLSTVRGCPFRCSHCVECGFHGKVRQLSAKRLFELVVQEHERSGQLDFEFLDDLFIAIPRRLAEFHHLLHDRGLLGRFRFWKISAVAHLLTDETMRMAKEIGVVDMGIGLESASPRVLEMFKGSIGKVEHISRAIELARNFGVPLGAAPVFGFPSETLDDMQRTIDFFEMEQAKGGFSRYGLWICMPLPGSALWDRGLADKSLTPTMDFSTLRIGGDEYPFQGNYYYNNEETVPRHLFEQKLKDVGYLTTREADGALKSPLLLKSVLPSDKVQGNPHGSVIGSTVVRKRGVIFVWDNPALIDSCLVLANSLKDCGIDPIIITTGFEVFTRIEELGFKQVSLAPLVTEAAPTVIKWWQSLSEAQDGNAISYLDTDLEALTHYEQQCIREGYPVFSQARSSQEIILLAALYLEAFQRILQQYAPACCFAWNGLVVPQNGLVALCKRRGIPVCFLERGLLPGMLVVDPLGVNYGGSLGKDWNETWKRLKVDNASDMYSYILSFRDQKKSIVRHGSDLEPCALRERFGITSDKRVILVPNQIDHDTNIICYCPDFPSNMKVIETLMEAIEDLDDVFVMVKTHPEDCRSQADEYAVVLGSKGKVVEDVALHSLLAVADLVLVRNSTVGLEALLFDKPVICLGRSAYSGKGFTIDITCPSDLSPGLLKTTLATSVRPSSNPVFHRYLHYLIHDYHIILSADKDVAVKNRLRIQEKLHLAQQVVAKGEQASGNQGAVNLNRPTDRQGNELTSPDPKTTVFIITIGDPVLSSCEEALAGQVGAAFKLDHIRNVKPFNRAVQQMIDCCTTEYFIQVDEDMILYPDAVKRMEETMDAVPPSVGMICFMLYDDDRESEIQGIKIYRTRHLRKVVPRDLQASEMDLLEQLHDNGISWVEHPDVMGRHGTRYTPETIYLRYKSMYEKSIRTWNTVTCDIRKKAEKYRETGDQLQLFALLGAVHGIIIGPQAADIEAKNTDFYRLKELELFSELFLKNPPNAFEYELGRQSFQFKAKPVKAADVGLKIIGSEKREGGKTNPRRKSSKRLSILHTVEFYHPHVGGSETVVREISERLARRGHSVTVATTRLAGRSFEELNGVRVRQFDVSGNISMGLGGKDRDTYLEFLNRGGFDIMMNYAAQQWATDIAMLHVARDRRTETSYVIAPCGYSALSDHLLPRVPEFREYFSSIVPHVLPRYDAAIYHSSLYRDYRFAERHGFGNSHVIPNGVGEEEFSSPPALDFRAEFGIRTRFIGLCVANYFPGKGHAKLLECVRLMNRTDFTLVCIGKEGDLLPGLRNLATGLPVVFLQDVPREVTVSAFHAADLFLFASEVEASPLVIIEAKASGTPFVSTDCGNVREWKGGIVCDAAEMHVQVKRLLDDGACRNRLAEEGRQEWKERLTWDSIVDQYENLYLELYAGKTRTSLYSGTGS